MQAFFIGVNSKFIHTALGIRCITEYCRLKGVPARMLEVTVNEPVLSVLTRVTEMIDTYSHGKGTPVLIGMEVHIWNRDFVLELAELLRKVIPDSLLMLGGPEVMFSADKVLADFPPADFIVCGEGEEIIARLLQRFARFAENGVITRENIGAWEHLIPPGIAYRNSKGETVSIAEPVTVQDLDGLPFPYPDLEEVAAQHKIAYYEASRGCPFRCAYCLSGISHSVRRRSLPLVLADMDRFIQAGIPLVKFVDRTYNLDESYYLPMMRYLAEADTKTTFHFEIKADILSRKALAFLKTVPKGRFQLEIGVQSTNPAVLEAIGRRDDGEKLKENIAALLQAGNMHIHLDLIAGLPLEDMKSFARSFDDLCRLHPHALQLGFLKVLPGTVMEKLSQQHGLVHMARPPYEILSTGYMGYKEIRYLKIMEEVFQLTANSGRFPFTLSYLTKHRSYL